MRCPFLSEKRVRFCEAAPLRVYVESATSGQERCTHPSFTECELKPNPAGGSGERCPCLREQTAQFCAAAPTCLVPAGDGLLSACHGEAHRYCELYLDVAPPAAAAPAVDDRHGLPPHLALARNHLWIDVRPDGTCHVGLDGLAAEALGAVERVDFACGRGTGRAAALLTVHGVPVRVEFPNPLEVVATNTRLRSYPRTLTEDPYRRGWLFRTREQLTPGAPRPDAGLLRGEEAASWLREQSERLGRSLRSWIEAARRGAAEADPGRGYGANGDPERRRAADADLERSARLHVLQEMLGDGASGKAS